MMRRWITALLCSASAAASALPMGSEDSWMVMADGAADERSLAVNFALTRHDALGAAVGQWRNDADARREFAAVSYTRLLHRWNLPHAQANLWFVGLAGSVRPGEVGRTRSLWSPAILADFETTRVYAAAGVATRRAGAVREDSAYLRAGFSFYEAEYEEPQPWLIAEAKTTRNDGASRKESAALWLRVIHKRYFVELGADNDGRARWGLMLNY